MKKYIILLVALVFSLSVSSCQQSLLDIEQKSVIDLDSFYSNATDDDALQLIASLYHFMYTQGQGHLDMVIRNGMDDDNYFSSDVSSTATEEFDDFTVTAENQFLKEMYSHYFTINYLSNLIVTKLNNESAERNRIIAEAKVMRAWAYMQLIRYWGTPPLVTEVISGDAQIPNGTKEELWDYVFTSLTEAAAVLPSKGGAGQGANANIRGRLTKEAAMALLGKAQFYSGDYESARQTLYNNVINTGYYALIPVQNLFHKGGDFSDEYIWEYNSEETNTTNYQGQGNRNKANYYGWRSNFMRYPSTIYQNGWGFGATTEKFGKFMDSFDIKADGSKSERYKNTLVSFSDFFEGDWKFYYNNGSSARLATPAVPTHPKDVLFSAPCPNCGGYFRLKDIAWLNDMFATTGSMRTCNASNWPHMRYAEVLLLYAEACLQTGTDTQRGLQYLNAIRTRAGIPTLASYSLEDIKNEKRAEMYWEGERFLDLVRWGDAATVLSDCGKQDAYFYGLKDETEPFDFSSSNWNVQYIQGTNPNGFQANKNELLPFPATEFYTNKLLVQNPGY